MGTDPNGNDNDLMGMGRIGGSKSHSRTPTLCSRAGSGVWVRGPSIRSCIKPVSQLYSTVVAVYLTNLYVIPIFVSFLLQIPIVRFRLFHLSAYRNFIYLHVLWQRPSRTAWYHWCCLLRLWKRTGLILACAFKSTETLCSLEQNKKLHYATVYGKQMRPV